MPGHKRIISKKELRELPKWARVAFAVRCTRRVEPLLAHWRAVPSIQRTAVDEALWLAELSAARAKGHFSAIADLETTLAAEIHPTQGNSQSVAARRVVTAAEKAIFAVWEEDMDLALEAVDYAVSAVFRNEVSRSGSDWTKALVGVKAMRRDFDLLLDLAKSEQWDDDTPVPMTVFGAMWPDGPPEGWPSETAEGKALEIEIEVPEGTPDDEVVERVRGLIGEADAAYRDHGGSGLKLDGLEVHREVGAEVPQ